MDEKLLNDLLECSVCLERLDTSSKVLSCQHTFCKKCLEEIVATHKELRCPECRTLVECRVDELPPNVLLMRILEGMKTKTTTTISPPKKPLTVGCSDQRPPKTSKQVTIIFLYTQDIHVKYFYEYKNNDIYFLLIFYKYIIFFTNFFILYIKKYTFLFLSDSIY